MLDALLLATSLASPCRSRVSSPSTVRTSALDRAENTLPVETVDSGRQVQLQAVFNLVSRVVRNKYGATRDWNVACSGWANYCDIRG